MATGKHNRIRRTLQILLPLALAGWLVFIFSNSLRVGEASENQSGSAVRFVQCVAGWIAPNGWIANAEGEDYDKLQGVVRKLAHFTEFAALAALACWTYFAYRDGEKGLWLPALFVACVPLLDEGIQRFVPERAAAWSDVAIDIGGEVVGFLLAWLLWRCVRALRNRKQKEE